MCNIEICSDNNAIKLALDKLISILEKNGCYFNSDVFVNCKNGELSINARKPLQTGVTLISITERCLVPVEDLTLKLKGEDIVLTAHDSSLSSLRLEIVRALISVFNLTDKIKHHNHAHPSVLGSVSADLYKKLLEGRSANEGAYKTSSKNKSGIAIQQMLKSRTMLYKRADKKSNKKTDMIMPVIDFFNHSVSAGPFIKSGTSYQDFSLSVSATVFDEDTSEYYVTYGYFDAYDMFLRYGYVDTTVDFVYSIPMTIDLPFFGSIVINCITGQQQEGFNAKNNHAEFLYLLIPGVDDFFSLRRNLYSAIREMGDSLTADQVNAYVQSAESMIINKNITFYEELKSFIPDSSNMAKVENMLLSVTSLVDVQLKIIRSYKYQ